MILLRITFKCDKNIFKNRYNGCNLTFKFKWKPRFFAIIQNIFLITYQQNEQHNPLLLTWYSYKMVTQDMLRPYEGKQVFSGEAKSDR